MTLSEKFLTVSKPSRRAITAAKPKEKEKKKFQKSKSLKTRSLSPPKTQNCDFCACPSYNALNRDAGGKKCKLLCCKCIFNRSKAKLAKIQPNNHQNVQKTHFLQKVPGINGLTKLLKMARPSPFNLLFNTTGLKLGHLRVIDALFPFLAFFKL